MFDAPAVQYNIIFGRQFLNQVSINVKSSTLTCSWYEDEIPFHPPNYFCNNVVLRKVLEVPPYSLFLWESLLTETKLTLADIEHVMRNQKHLQSIQCQNLLEVLQKHPNLFAGTQGYYP